MDGKVLRVGYRTGAIFLAGGLCGFLVAWLAVRQPETPTNLTLKASYLASGSDQRPRGFTPLARTAGSMWDARNEAGFEWGLRYGVVDRRDCPGAHGPFHAGCQEAADNRSGRALPTPR